ncbi:MAG: hypothetical protein WCV86_03505 [Patescibacteria group bacterium]|jgi:primosomal protein N'
MDARVLPLLRMPRSQEGFDYHIPRGMNVLSGDMVIVPFRKKKVRGIVWKTAAKLPEARLSIDKVLVGGAMTPLQQKIFQFVRNYYGAAITTLLKTTLPLFPIRAPQEFSREDDVKPGTQKMPLHTLILYASYAEKDADAIKRIQAARGMALCIFPTHAALLRFYAFLTKAGFDPTIIEHGQSANVRRENYEAVRFQKNTVLLTTKLGLFAPFPRLDLILIEDAEHPAHKQYDQQPYYDSRTLAHELAMRSGSALLSYAQVPLAETWHALAEKTLKQERAGKVPQYRAPTILNIRTERHQGNETLLSAPLREHLRDPDVFPALLYLNKIEHGEKEESRGIETLLFEIRELFPEKRIVVVSGNSALPNRTQIEHADIILATERFWSVAPYDFYMKTVVAIDADRDRLRTYFRARTKAFASLIRLRNSTAADGTYFIQTREPSDPLFSSLREKNWGHFFREELKNRNEFFYPPFAALTRLRFSEENAETLAQLETLKHKLPDGAELSPVFHARGKLPYAVLLKESPSGQRFGSSIGSLLPSTWTIDVDPLDLE